MKRHAFGEDFLKVRHLRLILGILDSQCSDF